MGEGLPKRNAKAAEMGYLRRVAKAVADDDPRLQEIAMMVLASLEDEMQSYRSEGAMIRQILTAVARAEVAPT